MCVPIKSITYINDVKSKITFTYIVHGVNHLWLVMKHIVRPTTLN